MSSATSTTVFLPRKSRGRSRSRSSSRSSRSRSRAPSRARIRRIRKPLALQSHSFVERTAASVMVVANESTATGLFQPFTLDQCLQASSYKDLFEYYKIDKVIVEFRYKGAQTPAYVTVPASSSGTQASYAMEINNEINPILYFKVDHNDIAADSLNDMKESMKTREHQFTNDKPNFTISLKPAVQTEAYKSAITTTYIPKWGQWLSTADGSVPHYGLKAYCVAGMSNNPNMGKIEVQYKIYFTCKNNE